MTSFVNISVTDANNGMVRLVAWGGGMSVDSSGCIVMPDGLAFKIHESPSEVAALVEAEIRNQRRHQIAAQALAGVMASQGPKIDAERQAREAAYAASVLTAVLDGAA